jgi:hypothetical protein
VAIKVMWTGRGFKLPRVTRVLLLWPTVWCQWAPKVDSIAISAWPSSPVWVLVYWRGHGTVHSTLSTSHVTDRKRPAGVDPLC